MLSSDSDILRIFGGMWVVGLSLENDLVKEFIVCGVGKPNLTKRLVYRLACLFHVAQVSKLCQQRAPSHIAVICRSLF